MIVGFVLAHAENCAQYFLQKRGFFFLNVNVISLDEEYSLYFLLTQTPLLRPTSPMEICLYWYFFIIWWLITNKGFYLKKKKKQ